MQSENILEEAMRITSEDRNKHYGHPRDNFANTALAMTAYLRACRKLREGEEITPRDVGWLMVQLKAMRDGNMPKRDNLVDAAGYLRCVERVEEEVDR
jgi:flagella basal body P-ring formation protein FlgA